MRSEIGKDITTIALAIVGLAMVGILVSRRATTTDVINSTSSAFNTAIAVAGSPVTGYDVGPPIYAQGRSLGSLTMTGGAGFRGGLAGAY